jgi:hypothetical protein
VKIRWFVVTAICLLFGLSSSVSGQWKISGLKVSSGQDAISSGIAGTVQFQNGHGAGEFVVQSEQAWFLYGPTFQKGALSGQLAGSIGHFQEAPWAGPYLYLEWKIEALWSIAGSAPSIFVLEWPAFFAWEPRDWDDGAPNPESIFVGNFTMAGVNVGPVGLSVGRLDFLDDPLNWLYGASYTLRLGGQTALISSATWNSNATKWMLLMGASWKPSS